MHKIRFEKKLKLFEAQENPFDGLASPGSTERLGDLTTLTIIPHRAVFESDSVVVARGGHGRGLTYLSSAVNQCKMFRGLSLFRTRCSLYIICCADKFMLQSTH